MKLLLDTHVFIWWTGSPDLLKTDLLETIKNPRNTLYVSAASSWEVQIKLSIGKIQFFEPWQTILEREIENNNITILPITLEHTFALQSLPPIHKDPFDRMLIAQAQVEDQILVTNDRFILEYPGTQTLWK